MQELEKRIGLLRLLIADITGKREQLDEMERQYRAQLSRIVEFVVYREGDVSNALSLMSEVQGKLNEVVQTSTHLRMLAEKASTELDVLVLTKRVADARSQLADLEARQKELSSRLSTYTGEERAEDLPLEETPPVSADPAEIHAVAQEVTEVAGEIARLNQLITEASARAARMVQVDGQRKS